MVRFFLSVALLAVKLALVKGLTANRRCLLACIHLRHTVCYALMRSIWNGYYIYLRLARQRFLRQKQLSCHAVRTGLKCSFIWGGRLSSVKAQTGKNLRTAHF